MVSAAMALRLKRQLEQCEWALAQFVAMYAYPRAFMEKAAHAAPAPKPREMFDYKMRQAGERDDG